MDKSKQEASKTWKTFFQTGTAKRTIAGTTKEELTLNKKLRTNQSNAGKSRLVTEWLNHPKAQPAQSSAAASVPPTTVDDDEEKNYFVGDNWWITQDKIPVNEQCTVKNCTYEPTIHKIHLSPVKFLSLVEKKIVVKYLISRNAISRAKGNKIFQDMIKDGYLAHRTFETLRNCFCKTILMEIQMYNLNQHTLAEFLKLNFKKK